MRLLRIFVAVFLGVNAARTAAAQVPERRTASPEGGTLCWRRVRPDCDRVLVTELLAGTVVASTRTENFDPLFGGAHRDFDGYVAGTVGLLKRRGASTARGVTLSVAGPQTSLFLETRRRSWRAGVDRRRGDSTLSALDLSIGYAQSMVWVTANEEGRARGATAAASYLMQPSLGLSARGTLLASRAGPKSALYVAAQVGGPAGPVVGAIVAVVGFIAFAANAPRS